MIDKSMTPAVRRSFEAARKEKLLKRAQNIPQDIPAPAQASGPQKLLGQVPGTTHQYAVNHDQKIFSKGSVCEIAPVEDWPEKVESGASGPAGGGDSRIPVEPPTLKMTVFEELHQSLSRAAQRPIGPQYCPHPDDLCRGCRDATVCG